jgi:exopolyphosphatase/pppGpp-phosphohydrolase
MPVTKAEDEPMEHFSEDDLDWWQLPEPTPAELGLSGGLRVEDWPHARHVMRLSVQLFEATCSLHGMDEKTRPLLERAAFLHNAGMLVETRRHHKLSYRLIKEAQLPGFTEEERHEIACIARYHRRALPSSSHEEFAALSRKGRERVSQLAALLRIADAFDYNHDARVLRVYALPEQCDTRTWTFGLVTRPLAELDSEIEHAYDKADLFEKVFKRKLHLVIGNGAKDAMNVRERGR